MQLSKRLQAVAALVTPGSILADVGTDHGYIPIYLAEAGIISRAIAMDINRGPLMRADQHIRENELSGRISVRLSDGLKGLRPGEADSVVIAGMGGPLMITILAEGGHVLPGMKELILQPQSEIEKVRAWLWQSGYATVQEHMIEEEGKYYPMMRMVKETDSAWEGWKRLVPGAAAEELALRYGPVLLSGRDECLRRYLEHEEHTLRQIAGNLEEAGGVRAAKRLKEIKKELELNRLAKEYGR